MVSEVQPATMTVNVDTGSAGSRARLRLQIVPPYPGAPETYDWRSLDLLNIRDTVIKYWKYVNEAVRSAEFAVGNERFMNKLTTELKSKGNELCEMLFTPHELAAIWRTARASTTVKVITDLHNVPWEALYSVADRAFLADLSLISRWPMTNGATKLAAAVSAFSRDRVLLLDPVLCGDPDIVIDGVCLRDALMAEFGSDLHETDLIEEVMERCSDVRVVQWICEHADEGLRLSKDTFFGIKECATFHFPAGSVLILTSCQGAYSFGTGPSFAAEIAARGNLTVISASSVVHAVVGAEFARRIERAIRSNLDIKNVALLWNSLRDTGTTAPEGFFRLWYSIYGGVHSLLRGDA